MWMGATLAAAANNASFSSVSYEIGGRQYTFTADYDAENERRQSAYEGGSLEVYYRSRAFNPLKQDGRRARYTCFRAQDVHFCTPKRPAPFW